MRLFGFAALIILLTASNIRGQQTNDFIQKIFQITATADHKETGTAFLAQIGDQVELITAKHLFENVGFPPTTTVYLNTSTGWKGESVTITYAPVYDMAALHSATFLKGKTGLSICVGQHNSTELLTFWGYPFQFHSDYTTPEMSKFIVPYVKHAYLAGSAGMGYKTHGLLVLDAINNYGFSGGPVVAAEAPGVCVYGVTIGFVSGTENVVNEQGKKTNTTVLYNSGLMYAIPPDGVHELFSLVPKASQ